MSLSHVTVTVTVNREQCLMVAVSELVGVQGCPADVAVHATDSSNGSLQVLTKPADAAPLLLLLLLLASLQRPGQPSSG